MKQCNIKYSTLTVALAYGFFVVSAFNYSEYSWFEYLLISRILLCTIGLTLVAFCMFSSSSNDQIDSLFLTMCLLTQASHGLLEPTSSIEFFQFAGILFLIAALSYNGNFVDWIKHYAPYQWSAILIPIIYKQYAMSYSLPDFADHFSLPIACLIIGTLLTHLSAGKYSALEGMLHYQSALAKELSSRYERVNNLSAQVAHDIRSPLAALNVVCNHLAELPEDKRIMIRSAVQRIEDIANDLATRKQLNESDNAYQKNKLEICLLSSLIDQVVSEKRTQLRGNMNVNISFPLESSTYGHFANLAPCELKRVISNLINNSVEAMESAPTKKGTVTVHFVDDPNKVIIKVRDNGSGIQADILPKLMERGATFGKAHGSGLGLFHARESLEKWGGSLSIDSRIGEGTTVTIHLPRAISPDWFVPRLQIKEKSTVVVLDDDASIHMVWDDRFVNAGLEKASVKVFHFTSGAQFTDWVQKNHTNNITYLCDHELLDEKDSGLDLIERLNVADCSVLVTSRFEEVDLRARCARLGVQLLPKGLAGCVPIEVIPSSNVSSTAASSIDEANGVVLPRVLVLDDDPGIHMAWDLQKDELGVSELRAFDSMEACEASSPNYNQFDYAFVDKNIPGSVWKTDQIITYLKSSGVRKVFVASGESEAELRADLTLAAADGFVPFKIPNSLS